VENFIFDNLYNKPECHAVSKAFSMSKNTAAVDILLLKLRVTWSVSLIHCSVVLWHERKSTWRALSRTLFSMCFWNNFKLTFSNNLPVVDKRIIGSKFWWNFGSLPGFGNIMSFPSFPGLGKWDSRRQWFNKWAKCTNGRLRRCLRHSFRIQSIPQAFLNFKDFINFCISQGLILWGDCCLRLRVELEL
jgi:hypothetical protein